MKPNYADAHNNYGIASPSWAGLTRPWPVTLAASSCGPTMSTLT